MGTWDYQPWSDDEAADWHAELFENTRFAEAVAEALRGDPEDEPGRVHAAAGLLVLLGRVYIWPIERLEDDLKLGIDALQRLEQTPEYAESEEMLDALRHERSVLESRLNRESPPDSADAREWWASWL